MEKRQEGSSVSAFIAARPVLSLKHHWWLLGVAVVMYGIDLGTKQLALHLLVPYEPHYLIGPWLQIQLLFNSGAAFSMGEGFTMAFAILASVALVALVILVAPRVRGAMENVVVGLLIAGVAGNLTDRIFRPNLVTGSTAPFHGSVVDFLGIKYFAVFNVADMCITAAAIIIIIALLRSSARRQEP